MKKGTLFFIFIVCTIIAAIATSSLWDGLGFALAVVIFIFSLICVGAVTLGIYAVYGEIVEKHPIEAIKLLCIVLICGFFGIKLIKWLAGVLS